MKNQKKLFPRKRTTQISKENRDLLTSSRPELSTLGNGKEDSEMGKENNHGLMERNIWENGEKTELTVREGSFM